MANYDSEKLKRLDPAYLQQYGLNQAPFSNTLDDNFLFLDAERHQRIEMLAHLTQYSNLLLIVTGERGVGKTSLMRRFCAEADESWYLCEVNANTMMDADTLLTDIAGGFGLNGLPNDPTNVQDIVFEHLKALQDDETVPILIIDDAHELPKDALETLFYFADIEAAQGHLLRIILFCEPQIDIMLESPSIQPLRERITHTLEINPFNEDQTAEFIKHRMAVAGFEGTSPFTPKVINKIHKISRGIPAHICELAHLHLDDAASLNTIAEVTNLADDSYEDTSDAFTAEDLDYHLDDQPHTPEADPNLIQSALFTTRHYVFIAIVATVSIIVLSMQDTINNAVIESPSALDTVNRNLPSTIKKAPASNKQKEITLKTPTPYSIEAPAPELEDAQEVSSQKTNPSINEKAPTKEDANVQIAEYTIEEVVPSPIQGSAKAQTITLTGSGFKSGAKDPSVVISWTGTTKNLKKHQYKIIDDSTIKLQITVGLNPDEWSVKLKQNDIESNSIAFSVIKAKAVPKSITKLAGMHDERWILDQAPNQFTLQVLATANKNNIKNFAKSHQLKNDIAVFQTIRNGKPWYSVIYGNYATKNDAALAKKKIASARLKPWLRRFDSVQAKINTGKIIATPQKPARFKKPNTTQVKVKTAINKNSIEGVRDSKAWLWSQDPRHYTLQLLGGRNDKSIQKFIRKYKLRDKAIYFHTNHNKRNWYALIYGSYNNRGEALQAIKELPSELQKTSPWARSFSSIHKDLDQSQ